MTDLELAEFIIDRFEAGVPAGVVTEDPDDYGGITRWGITRPYAGEFLRCPTDEVPKGAIRNLSREQAAAMLVELELRRPGLWAIADWRVKLVAADYGFNMGRDDSVPSLQRAVGAVADGAFGPNTLRAVNEADPLRTAVQVLAERIKKHVTNSGRGPRCATCQLHRQRKWLGGWSNRCAALLQTVVINGGT